MLVLTEKVITSLLQNLKRADAVSYQKTLLAALAEYEKNPEIIPPRIVTTTPYCVHLFMASTGSHVGMKAISGSGEGFKGITTILSKETGYPLGIINCTTLTAFRTALCNSLPLVKFFPLEQDYSDDKLIIFGVGDQAIWHARLTLILYPNRFSKVLFVNRTVAKAERLCNEVFAKEYASVKFEARGMTTEEEKKKLLEEFKDASVVFTCIPTSTPTVKKEYVDQCEGRCFIGAIGSYKPHMTEIDGRVLKESVLAQGGKIVVDSIDHCLHEAGELILNDIQGKDLVDVSSLYSDADNAKFLTKAKVAVSKLVGLCIMDVWVGSRCLDEARKQGVGLEIEDF